MPKRRKKSVPAAVSEYMAEMARKSHAVLKGTATARERASKAAKTRWAKYKAQKETSPKQGL